MAELVEGAPLLREYGVKNSIEGSNPSLSAIHPGSVAGFLAPRFYRERQFLTAGLSIRTIAALKCARSSVG